MARLPMTLEGVRRATAAANQIGAVGGLFLAIAVVTLALPVSPPRNSGSEKPPEYDCGSPFSYTTGESRQGWRVYDSQPTLTTRPGEADDLSGQGDFVKAMACQRAMAPRLGFTTWVLATGLLLVVILDLMLGRSLRRRPPHESAEVSLPPS